MAKNEYHGDPGPHDIRDAEKERSEGSVGAEHKEPGKKEKQSEQAPAGQFR